jgi:hypothetical protein
MKRIALAALAVAAFMTAAHAAGNIPDFPIVGQPPYCSGTSTGPTGQVCTVTVPAGPGSLTGTELFEADTGLLNGQQPQTVAVPATLLTNFSGTPRNYLDNGSLNVQQRGTGIVTCGTTTVPSSAYGPDRWGCFANVTSGAGRTSLVTTAALLPAGFAQVNQIYRTSGALTQPVCSIHEVPTSRAIALAGKTVSLSVFEVALAGLAADNANITTATIITGTGTDQGLQTMTASPAITPAWTGVATPLNQSPMAITTTPTRYGWPSVLIPATTTEIAVEFCFTPTATGAGVTDGFAYVGGQLEISSSPTAYEFHTFQQDLAAAQTTYFRWAELAAAYQLNAVCEATGANTNSCTMNLPQQMRSIPTITITTAGTFKVNIAGTLTTIATPTAGACGLNTCLVTAANTNTAGQVELLSGAAGGSGIWEVSADF